MEGTTINLGRAWIVGKAIGAGGFGRVFEATSGNETAAIKLVPKAPGAQRELLFVDLSGVRNVVPIIDSGEIDGFWVLVMPLAKTSLRAFIEEGGGTLDMATGLSVLRDVSTALVELDGSVVHRDLKPENVLLLDGRWCLADFGISRYAEATTAPDTHKFAMSAPYAAPERWRAERATSASDVYAAGAMGYEIFSGRLPFTGPTWEAFRDQHLHASPPALNGVPAALAATLEECLYKAPSARPTPANLLARVEKAAQAPASPGLASLAEANREQVRQEAESARRASEQRTAEEIRRDLFTSARTGLERIADELFGSIAGAAPAAKIGAVVRGGGRSVRLGNAELSFQGAVQTAESPWNWEAPKFQVIAHAEIRIEIPSDQYGYVGRSHSLWFCDAQQEGAFGWYETAFMLSGFSGRRSRRDPFSLDPGTESAKAVWNGIAEFQVAWPFTRLVPGDVDEFLGRWAGWLASASRGQLGMPMSMPERDPSGSWRR